MNLSGVGFKFFIMIALTDNIAEIKLSYKPTKRPIRAISSSLDAKEELIKWYPEETLYLQERFVVMYLNRANRVLGVFEASLGGRTGTVADPRLILSVALQVAAVSMVISHNHPSGNLKPSQADIDLTQKLKEGCQLLDIQLVDHIIISPEESDYYSFADQGIL